MLATRTLSFSAFVFALYYYFIWFHPKTSPKSNSTDMDVYTIWASGANNEIRDMSSWPAVAKNVHMWLPGVASAPSCSYRRMDVQPCKSLLATMIGHNALTDHLWNCVSFSFLWYRVSANTTSQGTEIQEEPWSPTYNIKLKLNNTFVTLDFTKARGRKYKKLLHNE